MRCHRVAAAGEGDRTSRGTPSGKYKPRLPVTTRLQRHDIGAGDFDFILMSAMSQRTFGTMNNVVLLAVPYFIFMGTVLEKSRLAEDLLETIGLLFGRFRAGLAIGVVLVGALLVLVGLGALSSHLAVNRVLKAIEP